MFDVNTTITIGGLRTSEGPVDIVMRWPTDEEWSTHRRRRKIIRKDLGRGAIETLVENPEGDSRLYEAIKLNGAPPLTQAEATKIIEIVGGCDVLDVVVHAGDAEVEMRTVMGEVKHTIRIPTMDQVQQLNRSSRVIILPFNRSEIRTNLEAPAELWDKCGGVAEGYNGPVPNLHKDVAIRTVIEAINQELAPRNDESNF